MKIILLQTAFDQLYQNKAYAIVFGCRSWKYAESQIEWLYESSRYLAAAVGISDSSDTLEAAPEISKSDKI